MPCIFGCQKVAGTYTLDHNDLDSLHSENKHSTEKKTCSESFSQYKPNRNTHLMRHTVVKPRYANVKKSIWNILVVPSPPAATVTARLQRTGKITSFSDSPMNEWWKMYLCAFSTISLYICTLWPILITTSTPIHARALKEKALAGYNSQQIPTNNDIHKMLIIIISLRWKHFVIISYLYKIPTINELYDQRKRDIRQTHTDILTA